MSNKAIHHAHTIVSWVGHLRHLYNAHNTGYQISAELDRDALSVEVDLQKDCLRRETKWKPSPIVACACDYPQLDVLVITCNMFYLIDYYIHT